MEKERDKNRKMTKTNQTFRKTMMQPQRSSKELFKVCDLILSKIGENAFWLWENLENAAFAPKQTSFFCLER